MVAVSTKFEVLDQNEMMFVDGGTSVSGVFVGIMLVSWAPVGACYYLAFGVGMALIGAGIIGKSTGEY